MARKTKITRTQREILIHLRDGGRLNRRTGTCQRVYEFVPNRNYRIILAKTVDQMMALGLLRVGFPPEGGLSTHLITDLGSNSIASNPQHSTP